MSSIPAELIRSLRTAPGFDEAAFEAVHQSGAQVTSIRFNANKITDDQRSFGHVHPGEPVPWSRDGYYLPERPSFTLDPLFHAGAYYVQEASSMFLEEAIKQTVDLSQPVKALDLCAAPGGKSTLIQPVINKESLLVSNEVIKTRVNILAENMTKWGAANVIVSNNDPSDFKRLPAFFDLLVVDAPCSGSGLFRKDPGAINEWSEHNVQLCAQRQQRILADIMSSLKPGGILIYSTCSYSPEEDEEICDWLLDEFKLQSVMLSLEPNWGIVQTTSPKTNAWAYRFYPDKVKGEGFFIAAFKKPGITQPVPAPAKQKLRTSAKTEKLSPKEIQALKPFLLNSGDFFFIKQNEELIAMPAHLEQDLATIRSALYIKKAGIKLGTLIREELIPSHELALANILNPAFPRVEVDKETALQYLRKTDLKIDAGVSGWVLLTHGQLPLGWVKIMQNRINNYYPKEWRILNK